MRFDGRALLVTCGASGIGAAVARRFTADGGRVAVVDRNEQQAQAVAGELEGAIAIAVDVTDEAAVGQCVDAVARHFGSIDCLFNAAGHAEFGPVEEWSLERVQRMLTAHVGRHVPVLPPGAARHARPGRRCHRERRVRRRAEVSVG